MGATTKIEWAHHTFNPWRGCAKVAAGCANCYAEAQSKRNPKVLGQWGQEGTRVVASEAAWKQPLKWNRAAACCCRKGPLDHEHEAGCPQRERPHVFCASLADVFEEWSKRLVEASGEDVLVCDCCGEFHRDDHAALGESCKCGRFKQRMEWATLDDVRRRLFRLIDATPNLDWLLLTKRPENILRLWPAKDDCKPIFPGAPGNLGKPLPCKVMGARRDNVWLGTSISTQADADRNLPLLLKCRDLARVLFVSAEPLLEQVTLPFTSLAKHGVFRGIDWVIVGGESGRRARPCPLPAVRSLVKQCSAAGVPCFVKQLGAVPFTPHPGIDWTEFDPVYDTVLELRDKKGGDPAEWPEDVRVRELPGGTDANSNA